MSAPAPYAATEPVQRLPVPTGVLLAFLIAACFLLFNHQAYSGFFRDDSFDNMGWTNLVGIDTFVEGLLTPRFMPNNFRPAGHYYFRLMKQLAGYHFPSWVAGLHVLHLASVWLLWLILRRLGAPPGPALAGLMFFAVHMAAFHAYWRPMFVFDLTAAFFTLLCLYLYMRGWLVPAFLAFWLAYKSKEMAVAIPVILALYEYWFSQRRWWRWLPFAAVSVSFTTQALIQNRKQPESPYTLHFTLSALWTCVKFYSKQIGFANYSGFALLLLPLWRRDRRVWFGLAMAACLAGPMMFLPGRLFAVYLYLPAAGVAIALAFVFVGRTRVTLALAVTVWLAANFVMLRRKAPHELEVAGHTRHYFEEVFAFGRAHPEVKAVTFRNAPPEMGSWGIEAIFRQALNNPGLIVSWAESPEAAQVWKTDAFAATVWDFDRRKLLYRVHRRGDPLESVISFSAPAPDWQLITGWYAPDPRGFCRTAPTAEAELEWPPDSVEFFAEIEMLPGQSVPLRLHLTLNGENLGARQLHSPGIQEIVWKVPASRHRAQAAAHPVHARVRFSTSPPSPLPGEPGKQFGVAVRRFGFRPSAGG